VSFDRRAQGLSRSNRGSSGTLASSLDPEPLGLQEATSDALRQSKATSDANPFSGSKSVTLELKAGRNTVPNPLGKKLSGFLVTSGSASLVSSTAQTMTLSTDAAGSVSAVVS
jgi:hypothetical protein